ncbi:unnamed protein product [Clonostachys byssicola]|uniref:Uncharacterized protein n=1 Tax=Clonostachys byssicola TaxID=160290 RepID=A0A9N9UHY7_9HYPO|nr:unnamed protein product [Clonostachys byssicola]
MTDLYAQVHEDPKGPGDARPTALNIIQDGKLEGVLQNQAVFITGCSAGMGVETAKAMYATGATLYLKFRNREKAQSALGEMLNSERVHPLEMDLNSLASVRACAEHFLSKRKTLNILICNAGAHSPQKSQTKDGFELHFGVNHLAHFLLFKLLKPALQAGVTPDRASRVVVLSSIAHRFAELNLDDINYDNDYHGMLAYGASKTANIWMANEIERRYGPSGLHAWSVNPGAVITELNRHMTDEERASDRADPMKKNIFKSSSQGAATAVWAATAKDLEGQGGGYLEDVHVSRAWNSSDGQFGPGYAPHALDTNKANKLWEMSEEFVKSY